MIASDGTTLHTTVVASKSRRVEIHPQRPTVIIGERCNALGYRSVREAARRGDFDWIAARAAQQVAAGADIVNVNMVGLEAPEQKVLPRAVRAILERVDVPLSLDFGDPDALEAALQVVGARPLINSINGEDDKLERVLPLMKEYDVPAIALTCDNDGIPRTAAGRLAAAEKIAARAEAYGLHPSEFLFDCVAMGVATDETAGQVTMESIRLVRQRLGANIALGASNASHGLPRRHTLNAAYLAVAIGFGLNCPITDPTIPELKWTVLSTDAVMGRDEFAIRYISAHRDEEKSISA